jgi:hypothetical protein
MGTRHTRALKLQHTALCQRYRALAAAGQQEYPGMCAFAGRARTSPAQERYSALTSLQVWAAPGATPEPIGSSASTGQAVTHTPLRVVPKNGVLRLRHPPTHHAGVNWFEVHADDGGGWIPEQSWSSQKKAWSGALQLQWDWPFLKTCRHTVQGRLRGLAECFQAASVFWRDRDGVAHGPALVHVAGLLTKLSKSRAIMPRLRFLVQIAGASGGLDEELRAAEAMLSTATSMTMSNKEIARSIYKPLARALGFDIFSSPRHKWAAAQNVLRKPIDDALEETTGLEGDKGAYISPQKIFDLMLEVAEVRESLYVKLEDKQRCGGAPSQPSAAAPRGRCSATHSHPIHGAAGWAGAPNFPFRDLTLTPGLSTTFQRSGISPPATADPKSNSQLTEFSIDLS